MAATDPNQAPDRTDVLFQNLFGGPEENTYELVADGMRAIRQNTSRLLSDAKLLAEGERLCSARFLITTAREEAAKFYILLDACRLDFTTHNQVIRKLCKAFYNHIAKHAYLEVQEYPNLDSMCRVAEAWEVAVRKWWPAAPESGEPSMPHDTVFDREFPLYVDFSAYARAWLLPNNETQKAYFMDVLGHNPIKAMDEVDRLLTEADEAELLQPECLRVINAAFRTYYVGDKAAKDTIDRLHQKAAERLETECGISRESYLRSALVQWPLYHCVTKGYCGG